MDTANFFSDQTENKLLTRKNVITALLIGILLLAVPFTVKLVQTQVQLKSKASAEPPIKFITSDTLNYDSQKKEYTTTSPTFDLELRTPPVSSNP